ncbi:hypothetical protein Taro_039561, partial [Colocasia esculenta]|nr:hypothetical protein [Colocasia esculenta]
LETEKARKRKELSRHPLEAAKMGSDRSWRWARLAEETAKVSSKPSTVEPSLFYMHRTYSREKGFVHFWKVQKSTSSCTSDIPFVHVKGFNGPRHVSTAPATPHLRPATPARERPVTSTPPPPRLLPERFQQSKSSDEAHFEALTTVVTMGFNKIEKLISSTSKYQDQPTFGTDAEKFFSTPPSLTPASVAPAYGDANASVLIVEQGIIAPDPVIDIVLHVMKERQREQEALIPKSYHRGDFLPSIFCSWIMLTDGSDDSRGHKLHTSLGHEKLGLPLSDFQFLFFVVHVSNHWFLLSLQVEQSRIVVYNSCRGHATYDTCARNWEPILKAYL